MKAIVLEKTGGPEGLVLTDVPDPVPGPEDLLVRIRATALNRGDLLQRMGSYPQPGPKPAFEVPGIEFAGEVLSHGDRVEGFAVGERVMGLLAGGGYAEQCIIHQRLAVKVPERMSWQEAGATPEVYITAHDALRQCDLVAGESVLVHAAGSGVGTAAVQVAKVMGATPIIGTARTAAKLEQARELGMDVGIAVSSDAAFAERVREVTGGGVDVILDVVGAPYWQENIAALAVRGRMVVVGTMGGSRPEVDLGQLLRKRLQVRGTVLRSRPLEEKAGATQAFARSVVPHLASGAIKVVVDKVFPLAEAGAAQTYMESNESFGKIVLEP
jgi:putative PIG3 family NAD(P)H quinone oxidoreductase